MRLSANKENVSSTKIKIRRVVCQKPFQPLCKAFSGNSSKRPIRRVCLQWNYQTTCAWNIQLAQCSSTRRLRFLWLPTFLTNLSDMLISAPLILFFSFVTNYIPSTKIRSNRRLLSLVRYEPAIQKLHKSLVFKRFPVIDIARRYH